MQYPLPRMQPDATGRLWSDTGRWHLHLTDGMHTLYATCDDPGTLYTALAAVKQVAVAAQAQGLLPRQPAAEIMTEDAHGTQAVPARPPEPRIGDAERDTMTRLLAAHYEAGRLTTAEFSDRSGRALEALHQSELDVLTEDLPAVTLPSPSLSAVMQERSVRNERPARFRMTLAGTAGMITGALAMLLFMIIITGK